MIMNQWSTSKRAGRVFHTSHWWIFIGPGLFPVWTWRLPARAGLWAEGYRPRNSLPGAGFENDWPLIPGGFLERLAEQLADLFF
jgi:hypothetical protein